MALLYGFHQLVDLAETRAITVDRDLLIAAVQMSTAQHNREVNTVLGLFSEDTTEAQLQFNGSTFTRNQPLDENGRSRPIKAANPYTTGFPIYTSGNAWGTNFVTQAKLTVQKLNDLTGMLLQGDFFWNRDNVLSPLFSTAAITYTDPQFGAVTVQPLANGDSIPYATTAGTILADTHQLAQSGGIADVSNPFPTILAELAEHPQNAGPYIVFNNSAETTAIKSLTNFHSFGDPNIKLGDNATQLVGSLGVSLPASATVLGYTDGVWNVQWDAIPATYLLGLATGGPRPLKRRIDPETELQGFRPVAERNDFPYYEQQWFRRAGFGGWNRVGAVVMRTGNSTYAVPTGYAMPIA